jgi:pantoate--beta-alanine ligase
MGALHEGHFALVRAARANNAKVVASIFVNPTQFAPTEDLSRYPRTPEADASALSREGVDLLYMPDVADMYGSNAQTSVHVKGVSDHMEGAFRPGHFDGVATVVAKLFARVGACNAYFGEKDWQQLQVVKHMVRDLDLPVNVVGVPTVREADGLALSSRNRYLNETERKTAPLIYATLKELAAGLKRDPNSIEKQLQDAKRKLEAAGFKPDYLELADAALCAPVRELSKPARLFIAAKLGGTRLIDNVGV